MVETRPNVGMVRIFTQTTSVTMYFNLGDGQKQRGGTTRSCLAGGSSVACHSGTKAKRSFHARTQ